MRTEDGSIINDCLGGKPQAFGMLVDKYKAGVYAYVCAEVRNFHDAQDITQEVFIQAYRDLRSLRKWESFTFWLYRIAYTRCKKWIRTRSRRPDSEFAEDQDPKVLEKLSLDAYRDSQVDESLQEALDSLSDTYREVLMLHYFGGMTIKDIARAVGASPTAIGVRLSRARAQLKEEMVAMMDTAFEGQKLQASFTFRIVTDMWTTVADLPTPRWCLTSNVVDGKIYSIGGEVGEEAAYPIRSPVSTVEEFDPGLSGNIAITSPAGKLLRTWGEVKSE